MYEDLLKNNKYFFAHIAAFVLSYLDLIVKHYLLLTPTSHTH